MKSRSRALSTIGFAVFAIGLTTAFASDRSAGAHTQTPQVHDHDHAQAAPDATATPADRDAMHMRMMKATDVRLAALVTSMKAARGDAKIDAMEALLTALAEEHTTMHKAMAGCPMMPMSR